MLVHCIGNALNRLCLRFRISQASLSRTMVREIMDPDPVCGSLSDTIDDLRQIMTDRHIRYLPVKEGDKLVGIISFHDVAKAVILETGMENRLLRRYIESQSELRADRS